MMEQSAYENFRTGETLPPEILRLLVELGVWERFLASDRRESYGIRSAWETAVARYRDFLYNPYGSGWHVDRARFDGMLACAAANAGAELMISTRLTAVHQAPDGGWRVEVSQQGKRHWLRGRFLVDATGRKAFVAAKLGGRAQVADRLIAAVAVLPRSEPVQCTLIEAVENGWWYSAPLPSAQTVFAYMTDSDLWRNTNWKELLKLSPLTSQRADMIENLPRIRMLSAASVIRQPVTGPNWMAAGDAALAFDPLSGQGIYKAVEGGLRSSAAIARSFEGDRSGIIDYENWTAEGFRAYLDIRRHFYCAVERWPRSPFWQRRMMIAPDAERKGLNEPLHSS
jgi:flavin-dependent dehydrogenase